MGFDKTEKYRTSLKKRKLLSLLRILFFLFMPNHCQVTFMAPSDRPAGTRQFWAWAQLSSGPALSVAWLKRGERNNASHQKERKGESGKGGRMKENAKIHGGSPSSLFLPSFPTPNLARTPPSNPGCLRVTAQSPLWGTGRQPRCSPPLKRVAFQQEAWWGKNKSHLHDIGTFYWGTMARSQESKGGDGLSLAVFLYFLFFFSKPNDVFQITAR